ncbi:MAG: hypothetical protein COB02_11315 [Candidatus Cloacimonadota bacterium]|nr:MAG: hypothetical protein COB02_11315 [Candidatus Cloacimonadota bacterium]
MRILVVDDSPIQCKIACHCLKDFGEVVIAESVVNAVSEFMISLKKKLPFDFIAMDYHLGDGTGFDAVKKIRNIEKAFKVKPCKIIYITADLDESSIRSHCSENEEVLIKPISLEKVSEKLKTLGL